MVENVTTEDMEQLTQRTMDTYNRLEIAKLLDKVKAAFDALTPEQQRKMFEQQRQSWVRAELRMKD